MKLIKYILAFLLWAFFLFTWMNQASWTESLEGEPVSEVKKLSLTSVDVVDNDILKLSFWVAIDDTKEKDFIVKSLPLWDEIEVNQIAVDNDNVLLSIEKDFESNKQYEVVIISLYWTDGSTIVSGIDWAVEFSAPDMSKFNQEEIVKAIEKHTLEENLNNEETNNDSSEKNTENKESNNTEENTQVQENDTENNTEENIADEPELNAAWEKPKTVAEKIDEANKKNNAVNLWWKEVDQADIDKNIAVAAGKSEDLPTTGPEHVFFVILAIILAGLIIHIRRKKV